MVKVKRCAPWFFLGAFALYVTTKCSHPLTVLKEEVPPFSSASPWDPEHIHLDPEHTPSLSCLSPWLSPANLSFPSPSHNRRLSCHVPRLVTHVSLSLLSRHCITLPSCSCSYSLLESSAALVTEGLQGQVLGLLSPCSTSPSQRALIIGLISIPRTSVSSTYFISSMLPQHSTWIFYHQLEFSIFRWEFITF